MLTKRDLRWTQKFFDLYSNLMLIPVTFQPVMLGGGGGLMESGKISIWRRIGFKMSQLLFTCQTLFVFIRTFEYVKYGDAGFFGRGSGHLNWDFVPVMIIGSVAYLVYDVIGHLIFDVGRELNKKVFNEIFKLRGKAN